MLKNTPNQGKIPSKTNQNEHNFLFFLFIIHSFSHILILFSNICLYTVETCLPGMYVRQNF